MTQLTERVNQCHICGEPLAALNEGHFCVNALCGDALKAEIRRLREALIAVMDVDIVDGQESYDAAYGIAKAALNEPSAKKEGA